MNIEYAVKTMLSDFQVNEVQNLYLSGGEYSVYYLYKMGLRTWECIDIIAKRLNICTEKISYAGLKDEDGVTGQFIAIYNEVIDKLDYKVSDNKQFYIRYIGRQHNPFRIGDLVGNSFHIKIRNLLPEFSTCRKNKIDFKFINYYDTQRFGIPGHKKVTHLIGKSILEQDYEKAFDYLTMSGSIDHNEINEYKNAEKQYFCSIHNSVFNFYLSAYDAYIWNIQIADILNANNDVLVEYEKDGFKYIVSTLAGVESYECCIPIVRHERVANKEINTRESTRFMYQNIICKFSDSVPDDLYAGKNMLDVDFFLPPGCYATTVIDQLIFKIYYMIDATNNG